MSTENLELTVIMPCLNESDTIGTCIRKALTCMQENNIKGEVLIADNGSTDNSAELAIKAGAKVIHVTEKGYGAALIGATKVANGIYCIMGDADDSYDFSNLMPYILKLREGFDLVMGNRFKGGIDRDAMPLLHKHLGTPVISFLGRLFYHNTIGDFNCGMRGYNRSKILELNLQTTGMEYASEMIVKSSLNKLNITEVPTPLHRDGRSRPPHLNTWSDGWRHLKFLLLHSPNWLFLYPGIVLSIIGLVLMALLIIAPLTINKISFDINSLLFGCTFLLMGVNAILFSCYTRIYAFMTEYIPPDKLTNKISKFASDKGIFIGAILFILGVVLSIISLIAWSNKSFGDLEPQVIMRLTIPAAFMMMIGLEIMFGGFFIGILKIKH